MCEKYTVLPTITVHVLTVEDEGHSILLLIIITTTSFFIIIMHLLLLLLLLIITYFTYFIYMSRHTHSQLAYIHFRAHTYTYT